MRGSSSSGSSSSSSSNGSAAANDGGGESDAAGGVVLPPSAAAETASAALLTEDITVLESWLRKGGDVDAPLDADGTTLLMSAAATTNHPALEVLLQQPGAQVNRQRAADGCTALLCSIQGLAPRAQRAGGIPGGKLTSDDLVPVKLLLNAAADPDIAAFKGRVPYAVSPLLLATQLNATQIVSMLLEARASTDHPDDAVPRPLIVACANNHVSLVQLLLQHGARSEPPELGATALTISCELGDTSKGIVEVLLAHNASPNRADACGNTPLMWAAEANAPDVAEILLNAGACPRRVNAAGDAALNIALKHAEQGAPTPLVDILTRHTAMTTPPLLQRRVVLRGLSGRPELNGRRGTAVSFDPATGRYGVQLEGASREKVALRPASLRPVTEEEEALEERENRQGGVGVSTSAARAKDPSRGPSVGGGKMGGKSSSSAAAAAAAASKPQQQPPPRSPQPAAPPQQPQPSMPSKDSQEAAAESSSAAAAGASTDQRAAPTPADGAPFGDGAAAGRAASASVAANAHPRPHRWRRSSVRERLGGGGAVRRA